MSWQDHGRGEPTTVGTVMLASDGDRDAAARVLSEAFADGRLAADEHGERVRAAYAARTWPELARLTADLPDPADAAGPVVAGGPEGPDWCLCALLIACPPAGIAWLLASRHRSHALQRRAVTAAAWSSGAGGAAARGVEGRRAEDR